MKGRFAMIGVTCALIILVGAGCTQGSEENVTGPDKKVAGDTVSTEGGDSQNVPSENNGNSDEGENNESNNEPDGKGGMVY